MLDANIVHEIPRTSLLNYEFKWYDMTAIDHLIWLTYFLECRVMYKQMKWTNSLFCYIFVLDYIYFNGDFCICVCYLTYLHVFRLVLLCFELSSIISFIKRRWTDFSCWGQAMRTVHHWKEQSSQPVDNIFIEDSRYFSFPRSW